MAVTIWAIATSSDTSAPFRSSFMNPALCCFRIGIEPNNFGLRMKAFDKDRGVSGTAADLDDTMVRPDVSLIDQLSVDCFEGQQLLKRIVKRKQPVVPHPREVGL